jgi:hypothetical protein
MGIRQLRVIVDKLAGDNQVSRDELSEILRQASQLCPHSRMQ